MAHQDDSLQSLIRNYHELNSSTVDELSTAPTALEFMRYVARNRPFVVRKAAANWPAVRKWDAAYLRTALDKQTVKVAITPHGNADAVVEDANGALIFVQPWEVDEQFSDFLDVVQRDAQYWAHDGNARGPMAEVRYAQTQNDNLRGEYAVLMPDVPASIDFASAALGQEPDAVNFWLGNARSTTALHKDNYENVYVQVRGRKHFTLLPPVEASCVNEKPLPSARYLRCANQDDAEAQLEVDVDTSAEPVPVAIWDPDEPEQRPSPYSIFSRPMRVTLDQGDMLYLPAMWYHKVGQSAGPQGFACSVNYWYDMDFAGGFWAMNAFVRDVVHATNKEVIYPPLHTTNDNGGT